MRLEYKTDGPNHRREGLVDLSGPSPAVRPGARAATWGGGRDNNLDLVCGRRPVHLWPLVCSAGAHGAHLELVLFVLAPVQPHLEAENDVERERERKPGADDGVADLGGGGEEAREAAADLGDDGKGGELACALSAVILSDLGELGEEGERQGGELEEGECGGGH